MLTAGLTTCVNRAVRVHLLTAVSSADEITSQYCLCSQCAVHNADIFGARSSFCSIDFVSLLLIVLIIVLLLALVTYKLSSPSGLHEYPGLLESIFDADSGDDDYLR